MPARRPVGDLVAGAAHTGVLDRVEHRPFDRDKDAAGDGVEQVLGPPQVAEPLLPDGGGEDDARLRRIAGEVAGERQQRGDGERVVADARRADPLGIAVMVDDDWLLGRKHGVQVGAEHDRVAAGGAKSAQEVADGVELGAAPSCAKRSRTKVARCASANVGAGIAQIAFASSIRRSVSGY